MWYVASPSMLKYAKISYINSIFSEYGHIAYQIKGIEAYNNMQENSLSLHTLLTPDLILTGGGRGSESAKGTSLGYLSSII